MSDTGREGTFFAVEDGARWACSGRIALDNAQKVLEAANGLPLPKGGVVDLSGLEHADSATLAVLLALRRRASTEGADLAFVDVPPVIVSLARVYGVDSLVGV